MVKGRIKRIHVNRQKLASNLKHGTNFPTITCKVGKENHYGSVIEILGPSKIFDAVLCRIKPLSCGAKVWIETKADVCIDGELIT